MAKLDEMEFAVVDVETTGMSSRGADRVLEVAVYRLRGDGTPVDEYVTLLHPGRAVSCTFVHGIEWYHVLHAPTFAEVLHDVTARLEGAVLVGHNARFDEGFLRAEYTRAGAALPSFTTLCTVRLAKRYVPELTSRKLSSCCSYFGISQRAAHTALDDARATGQLLARIFERVPERRAAEIFPLGATRIEHLDALPLASGRRQPLDRRLATEIHATTGTYLTRLAARLERGAAALAEPPPEAADSYLSLLARVVADRRVTAAEVEQLTLAAQQLQLTAVQVQRLHHAALRRQVSAARARGALGADAMRQLQSATRLLGLTEAELVGLINAPPPQPALLWEEPEPAAGVSLVGRSVCFTGVCQQRRWGRPITRSSAETYAEAAGLRVESQVGSSLDFLVAADPLSVSQKAVQARKLGIRIVPEAEFWNWIGLATD